MLDLPGFGGERLAHFPCLSEAEKGAFHVTGQTTQPYFGAGDDVVCGINEQSDRVQSH